MNDARTAKLLAVVHRSRNILWRQRLVQSLWYGYCAAAFALLLLALAHVVVTPVPMIVWLPCMLAPPLLAALRVALWQRPSLACAAAELDRQGACNDLLVTAWEVLASTSERLPAGAEVVLDQADAICQEINTPRAGARMAPWRGRLGATPLTVLVVALFLLQLPTPHPPARMGITTAGGASGSGGRPPTAATTATAPDPGTGMNPIANTGTDQPAGQAVAADSTAVAPDPGAIDQDSGEDKAAAEVPAAAASGDATAATDPMGAGDRDGDAAATRPDNRSGVATAANYQDIARDTAPSARREIAGTGQADLIALQQALPGAQLANIVVPAAQRSPTRYNNRFSLQQRLQISAYFDRLEESP